MVPWIHLLVNFKDSFIYGLRFARHLWLTFIHHDNISNLWGQVLSMEVSIWSKPVQRIYSVIWKGREQDYIQYIAWTTSCYPHWRARESGAPVKAVNGKPQNISRVQIFSEKPRWGNLSSNHFLPFFQEDMPKIKNLIPERKQTGSKFWQNLLKK